MINNAILGVIAGQRRGPPAPTDPYWSNVVLLVTGNGSHGATTFTDLSSHGHTVVNNGGVAVSTSQTKFGGGSMTFSGSNWLSVTDANPSAFAIDLGNFTFEGWAYRSSAASIHSIMSITGQSSGEAAGVSLLTYPNTSRLATYRGGTFTQDPSNMPSSQWFHWALVRISGVMYLYIDGVQKASSAFNVNIGSDGVASIVRVGLHSDGSSFAWRDHQEQVRMTTVARYASDFTPPDGPFPTG